jgi:hypothetical protein
MDEKKSLKIRPLLGCGWSISYLNMPFRAEYLKAREVVFHRREDQVQRLFIPLHGITLAIREWTRSKLKSLCCWKDT